MNNATRLQPFAISDLARDFPFGASRYKAMAMLHAYFDETGTHGQSEAVMIAGFVATADLWEALQQDWLELLGNVHMDYFHATECEASDGIYSSLQRPFRDALFLGLSEVIAKHRPVSVASAIWRSDWDKYKTENLGWRFNDPYHYCFEMCLRRICEWSKAEIGGEPIGLTFGDQIEYKARAIELYDRYTRDPAYRDQLAWIKFAPASKVVPLQAADLQSYELRRAGEARRKDPNAPFRPAAKVLDTVRLLGSHFNSAAANALLDYRRRMAFRSTGYWQYQGKDNADAGD